MAGSSSTNSTVVTSTTIRCTPDLTTARRRADRGARPRPGPTTDRPDRAGPVPGCSGPWGRAGLTVLVVGAGRRGRVGRGRAHHDRRVGFVQARQRGRLGGVGVPAAGRGGLTRRR